MVFVTLQIYHVFGNRIARPSCSLNSKKNSSFIGEHMDVNILSGWCLSIHPAQQLSLRFLDWKRNSNWFCFYDKGSDNFFAKFDFSPKTYCFSLFQMLFMVLKLEKIAWRNFWILKKPKFYETRFRPLDGSKVAIFGNVTLLRHSKFHFNIFWKNFRPLF